MLPFLKKRIAPIVIQAKQSEGRIKEEPMNESANEGLKQAFTEIAKAISAGDMDAGAEALKAFLEICDSYEDESSSEEAE